MLKSLYIKNYAIIDELNIEFDSGFNVFTGETGAGKSIIVGALSYLIKGKADVSVIKSGQDKAIIEGIFSIDDFMIDKLNDADIDYDDELIVRRVISRDGHNTIKINQTSVTLNFLSDLLSENIDIHSQKESQYLLNKKNHLSLLDRYCNSRQLLEEYEQCYREYIDILNEYNDLSNNTYNESELEFYKYDLKELEDANISIDEEEDLLEKEKRYKSSEKYISSLSNALNVYDHDNGIKQQLKLIAKELNIDDKDINDIKDNINNIYYSLEEETNKLKNILKSFENDDINIEHIEERLYLYSKLKRKHNCTIEQLIEKKNNLKEKIAFFENKDIVLNEKKKQLDVAKKSCVLLANKIHEIRISNATKLENDVIEQTEDLMLNNVVFKVNIITTDLNRYGKDDVEFFISLNKGEDLKPLKDVASGGEISRLMLALKTIFTALSNCSLVIFDEIDSGVSGKVGLSMGQKMKSISKTTQVLSISHLAPVAACADSHYFIYKDDNETSTTSHVRKLNNEERIQELANISSTDTSDKAIAAAKELFKLAQES